MRKPIFNKKRIQKLIQEVFSDAKIISYKKLEGGLVHSTFKVKISKSPKNIVVRLSKMKNLDRVTKNNKVLDYLHNKNIPAPKIYLQKIYYGQLTTIMELLAGEDAEKAYIKAREPRKIKILKGVGKTLSDIHNLSIPDFWINHKHEVKNDNEWIKWTSQRIKKYLIFVKRNLPEYHKFLKKEFDDFQKLLVSEKKKLRFVPLHWDYHLANMNVDSKGKVVGVFDFDNCMKGHDLADMGQTKYC